MATPSSVLVQCVGFQAQFSDMPVEGKWEERSVSLLFEGTQGSSMQCVGQITSGGQTAMGLWQKMRYVEIQGESNGQVVRILIPRTSLICVTKGEQEKRICAHVNNLLKVNPTQRRTIEEDGDDNWVLVNDPSEGSAVSAAPREEAPSVIRYAEKIGIKNGDSKILRHPTSGALQIQKRPTRIAEGSYGQVVPGKLSRAQAGPAGSTGAQPVAVKRPHKHLEITSEARQTQVAHCQWLKERLGGIPGIILPEVWLYHTRSGKEKSVEVSQLGGEDLWTHRQPVYLRYKGRVLNEKETKVIVTNVLRAIAEVHNRGTLHVDIKPENIIVMRSAKGDVVGASIIDFDSAMDEKKTKRNQGTQLYLSPEMGNLDGTYNAPSRASDCWAVGMTLYSLLHNDELPPPLAHVERKGMTPQALKKAWLAMMAQPKGALSTSTHYQDWWRRQKGNTPLEQAILGLIDPDPKTRLTAQDVCKVL
jgi:hypothetical protein